MLSLDDWLEFSDGLSEQALLGIVRVHRTTLLRWRAGRGRIPYAARELVRIVVKGELPPRGTLWRQWSIGHDGLLHAPDLSRGFSPSDLYALHWLKQSQAWRQARASRSLREASAETT